MSHNDGNGKSIEEIFAQSWKYCEWHFNRYKPDAHLAYLNLIQLMNELGYTTHLRAGTQLMWLLVSRSKSHGLRRDQPYIHFYIKLPDRLLAHYKHNKETIEIEVPSNQITDELDNLLQRLLSHPID